MPNTLSVFNPDDFSERIKVARAAGALNRALYFDTSVRGLLDLLIAVDAFCSDEPARYFRGVSIAEWRSRFGTLLGLSPEQLASIESGLRDNARATSTVRMCIDFLVNYVFTFIKCFDAKRSFEDESNFYMEREWRIGANIRFDLNDVARVFFPAKYAVRFRGDLPNYLGQISFLD